MAFIDTQYDPNWSAFQKSYQSSNPLMQTDAEKADQAKMDQMLLDIYNPKSPNYHKYVDNAQTAFPGVQQWIQDQMQYNQSMQDAFTKQYGHSPILGSTVGGPIMNKTQPKNTAAPQAPPTTTAPTTTTGTGGYFGQPVNYPSATAQATVPQSLYSNLGSLLPHNNYSYPTSLQTLPPWSYSDYWKNLSLI